MINFLVASMLSSIIAIGFRSSVPAITAIMTIPAVVFGLWFIHDFGALVIMCLEKYAGM